MKFIHALKSVLPFLIVGLCQQRISAQVFSNTTVSACNSWDSGGGFGVFVKNVTVSGLPAGGLTPAGTVLRQINLQLGNSSCTGNLSTYQLRLTNPGGTSYTFSTQLASTISSIWVDMSFRDHASLERLRDYTTTVQNSYYPHSIGYYRTETAGGLSNFNDGTNPNGTWVFSISEGTSSEVSFEKIELVFGSVIQVQDLSSVTTNNECSGSECIDGTEVTIGTNNGFSQSDQNYPGNTVNGCSWNGANNNSAWYEFYASGTNAIVTISGMANSSGSGSSDMQPIILTAPSSCAAPTTVPTGGCPDNESVNNSSYLSSNGGGISNGNVYVNGITDNCEFNLSGLTAGQKYYLYVDGNGGASSTYYIEVLSGAISCSIILPVDFKWVQAEENGKNVQINWIVDKEIQNDYFEVERSSDAINWNIIGYVNADMSLSGTYAFTDVDPGNNLWYYRVRQKDMSGRSAVSSIAEIRLNSETELFIFPDPATDYFIVNSKHNIDKLRLISINGYCVRELTNLEPGTKIEIADCDSGIYFVEMIGYKCNRVIKLIKL